jgi:hypothetical protein
MSRITEKKFNKNMLIMLVSIMVGAILVTYFAADILRQSKIDDLEGQIASHEEQIQIKEKEIVEEKNRSIKFTNGFLLSTGELDRAREDRSQGNYHFDLANLFYNIALTEDNTSSFYFYKNRTIDNTTLAMPEYNNSYDNFINAAYLFNQTKNFTDYPALKDLIDSYINLTHSGAKLTKLLYNASILLKQLAEKLKIENGTVSYEGNTSYIEGLLESYDDLLDEIEDAEDEYAEDSEDIKEASDIDDEYSFDFKTTREL